MAPENELNINVQLDKVEIAGQEIKRPPRIPRSDWIRYWERISQRPMAYTILERKP